MVVDATEGQKKWLDVAEGGSIFKGPGERRHKLTPGRSRLHWPSLCGDSSNLGIALPEGAYLDMVYEKLGNHQELQPLRIGQLQSVVTGMEVTQAALTMWVIWLMWNEIATGRVSGNGQLE